MTLTREDLIVEPLNGTQAGSVFTLCLSELKKKRMIVDRATRLYSGALLGVIFFGVLALICAVHWGEGIATPVFWTCFYTHWRLCRSPQVSTKEEGLSLEHKGGIQAFGGGESAESRIAPAVYRGGQASVISQK